MNGGTIQYSREGLIAAGPGKFELQFYSEANPLAHSQTPKPDKKSHLN